MNESEEKTASEAGVADDRALLIMLQCLADGDGKATFDELVRAVERQMGGPYLSESGRDALHQILVRDGFRQSLVILPEQDGNVWTLGPRGREFLQSNATELEEKLGGTELPEDLAISKPFDPTLIRVDMTQMTIFQVMRKINLGEIWLQPDFQRNLVWDNVRKSRLIESVLLRIPLPAFYLDAARDDRWQVVDGLQRLSTLHAFYSGKLVLTGLEFLKELEGRIYTKIPRSLQRQIEDNTRLTMYIIQPDTPKDVKFMIFSRVNTGGLPLTAQEIRHALFEGPARELIKKLAESQEFLQATTSSVSPLRMDDRECVLRFLAFFVFPYQDFNSRTREDAPANLDGLLNRTMEQLNNASPEELEHYEQVFRDSMRKAILIFGPYAFRKMYSEDGKRYPISKPLFEAWSVLLVPYSVQQLTKSAGTIRQRFIAIMNNDTEFGTAISLGTGSRRNIINRFQTIEQLLQTVLQ